MLEELGPVFFVSSGGGEEGSYAACWKLFAKMRIAGKCGVAGKTLGWVDRIIEVLKMKTFLSCMVVSAFLCVAGLAFAGTDDAKWVAQCIQDNKDAKVSVEVITKYCTCMNNKMDDNETLSITQWEKTHKAEREACDKEAGWN
jgi:hypothetical protein